MASQSDSGRTDSGRADTGRAAFGADAAFFSPHPDDAELFCGGTIALLASRGYRVTLVDLTRGEMGSQGTAEIRAKESKKAESILGLSARENLGLPDGGLAPADDQQVRAAIGALRRIRAELLFLPYWQDRHPDHNAASVLMSRALFLAGLKKYAPGLGRPYQPRQILFYQLRTAFRPSFIIDVSAVYDTKRQAVAAYSSQLLREANADDIPPTLISSPLSQSSVEARDQYYGGMIGVRFGEPFLSRSALSVRDPLEHFRLNPVAETLILPGDL